MGKDLKFIEWDLLTTFFIDNRKEFERHCLEFGHDKHDAKTIYLNIGKWLLKQEQSQNDGYSGVCLGREKNNDKGVTWEKKQ